MNDPVVARWLAGWSAVRDVEITEIDGWPLVHVNGESRQTEIVCVEPEHVPYDLVADDPTAMLTVITADRSRYQALDLPPSVRVDRDDETLMTTVLPDVRPGEVEFDTSLVVTPQNTRYDLVVGDRMVAWGTLGVLDEWATFDRIETAPAHRRRGLGRHVMDRLTEVAREQGATHGVLAASADGRALYEALGWRVHLEMWSLMGA